MKGFKYRLPAAIIVAAIILLLLPACVRIPMRDGQLVVGKDTTASLEDFGVASLNSKF